MGDSDNNTTLSFVTRKRVVARTAIAMVGPQPTEPAREDLEKDERADPALTAWRKWRDAHNLTERLCREQQRLERTLAETVGFPCAVILQSNGDRVTLHSLKELSEVVGAEPIHAAARTKAEADFAAHQARWDAADKEIGYSAAMLAEREAADQAEELLKVLSETPATTVAGVAAKLDAVLKEGQSSEGDAEFPWPQIRSAFEDIGRISRQTEQS
ncbi:hypothetical protein NKJ46_26380 [Mesorhizobium sp. M0166]|uniref:hypothetical protein n=1 Tax=unclassified Mesorhizobium TaxID=325217 RepID=UPI00333D7936